MTFNVKYWKHEYIDGKYHTELKIREFENKVDAIAFATDCYFNNDISLSLHKDSIDDYIPSK